MENVVSTPKTNSKKYETERLERENTLLRRALSFYANPQNWEKQYNSIGEFDGPAVMDCGQIALDALDSL